MLYPREWEKGEGESLCMLNIVHVKSVEEEKRPRTIPDFELILTLRNHLRVHSLLLETPRARCVLESELLYSRKGRGALCNALWSNTLKFS